MSDDPEVTDITHHVQGLPLAVAARKIGSGISHFKAYQVKVDGQMLGVFATREDVAARNAGTPDVRWHLSVSHPHRLPKWAEVAAIVHAIRPGVPFAMGIPPKSWWVNIHQYVLHAFEIKDQNLIDQWRFEGRGDRPT